MGARQSFEKTWRRQRKLAEREYVIAAIDDWWVEPDRCLIVGPDGSLVAQSLPHRLKAFYPSVFCYARRRSGTARIDEALVYDGSASTNYYDHMVSRRCCCSSIVAGARAIPRLSSTAGSTTAASLPTCANVTPLFASINWLVHNPASGSMSTEPIVPMLSRSRASGVGGSALFMARSENRPAGEYS